jgi:hypothetical protein
MSLLCSKYKQRQDRICELGLVSYFMHCDGCSHFKEPANQKEVNQQ